MIIYEPNKHFLWDIKYLAKSWTMVKIMRGVAFIAVWTMAIGLLIDYAGLRDKIFMNEAPVFSFIGIVLSILLVFRTNSAYDRWWEGRKQWGALVNHCRNLAIVTNASLPKSEKAKREKMATHLANFCIAFKEHLRGGVKLEELISVSQSELEVYQTKKHVPAHISAQIHQLVEDAHQEKQIDGFQLLNFKPHTQALMDILGACERIRKTPIPFSYAIFIRIFIIVYNLLLPFSLFTDFGYWSIPMMMIIFFAFIGIELMAEEIEDPFGLDCNDLPTSTIAHTIKNNVFEILLDKEPLSEVTNKLYEKIH